MKRLNKTKTSVSSLSLYLVIGVLTILNITQFILSRSESTKVQAPQQCPICETVSRKDNYGSCSSETTTVPDFLKPHQADRCGFLSQVERQQLAASLYEQAASFSGERGEGRQGWLHLLAAYSYDKKNADIMYNLFMNYASVGYDMLGVSFLMESGVVDASIQPNKTVVKQLQQAISILKDKESEGPGAGAGAGCTSLLYTTPVSRWDLKSSASSLPATMNADIYRHAIDAYLKLQRAALPDTHPTDLNHQFFKMQMDGLDPTNTYWGPLRSIPGFEELVSTMRACARRYLRDSIGWSDRAAARKAAHPLVVWVSVHTDQSEHQPHVTEDAMIGGVYYVSTPVGSGVLDMYDPRGKQPLFDLKEPTSAPHPPFHKVASLRPAESLLVLFPGWLVHSVRKPGRATGRKDSQTALLPAPSQERDGEEGEEGGGDIYSKFRVSLSLNLKGEWMDTSNAAFGCPTLQSDDEGEGEMEVDDDDDDE